MARMFNPPHPGEVLREFLPDGMTIEEVHLPLESVGNGNIVRVHPSDVLSPSQPTSPVQCRDHASVLLVKDLEAIVEFGVLLKDASRVVGGAVIDDDELKFTESLAKDTVKGFPDVFFAVTDCHDDTHQRSRRHFAYPTF